MAVDDTDPATPQLLTGPRALVVGETFGVYRIESLLGVGGMGEVYLAHDERLERRVAIKVVNALTWGEFSEVGRARLTREALALAKLSHPNIVTVFDIGRVGEHAYVAMEYVDGGTLTRWLTARPRSLREILDVFAQAGRGLAAAHGADLVHRDFKPDNVLVDAQGRARVSDFGLVTGSGLTPPRGDDTVTHGSLGTPAYMAPEQHAEGASDARSDQYSFCVSLWEALRGQRPFAGRSPQELRERKEQMTLRESPTPRLPARLRAAILRGLSPDPARRFPSMEPLLAALAHDPAVWRRRAAVLAATALVAGASVFLVLRASSPGGACLGGEQKLAGVWDEASKAKVRVAFAGGGRAYGEDTYRRTAAELDRYAEEWTAMRREACVATAVRREQSEALLDLRMQCLDGRLRELDAVVHVLAAADGNVIDRAVQAALGLPAVSGCADAAALSAVVPLPADPGVRLAAGLLRARLAVARAHQALGRPKDVLSLGRALADEATALGVPALMGETLSVLAELQRTGDRAAALGTARAAMLEAARAHDDLTVARAAATEMAILAADLGRFEDALLIEPGATAAMARAGNPPRVRVWLLRSHAIALGNRGQVGRAREQLELALQILEPLPHTEIERAGVLNDLTIWLRKDARLSEAAEAGERALALYQQGLGERHSQCSLVLSNLSLVAFDAGDLARSEDYVRRALAIAEAAWGPESQQVGRTLNNLGMTLLRRGDLGGARDAHRRALAVQEKVLGPDHVELATTLNNLGNLQAEAAEFAAARRSQERALAIQEKAKDVRATWSLYYLGEAYAGERDFERARSFKQRAIEQWTQARGPDHPVLADAISSLARIELEAGRLAQAGELARRALSVRAKSAKDHQRELGAETELLALVLDAQGKHEDARARHEEALAILTAAVPADDVALADPLTGLGRCHLELGRVSEAVPLLERATALRGDGKSGPVAIARTRFALARALWASGLRDRAATLARQALAVLPEGLGVERAPIAAWVRTHPG